MTPTFLNTKDDEKQERSARIERHVHELCLAVDISDQAAREVRVREVLRGLRETLGIRVQ